MQLLSAQAFAKQQGVVVPLCHGQHIVRQILADHLSGLTPGHDFHLISLDPALFEAFPIVEPQHCLTVAMTNMGAISAATLAAGLGGTTGHYLLLTDSVRDRHAAAGQRVGTGFIRSRRGLYREINRDMSWVFTNDAVRIQRHLDDLKQALLT